MQEYIINVGEIEELQTVNNRQALENIFAKAKSTIVNGEAVILVRKDRSGKAEKFDAMTTLEELESWKKTVFRYLK